MEARAVVGLLTRSLGRRRASGRGYVCVRACPCSRLLPRRVVHGALGRRELLFRRAALRGLRRPGHPV
eukprot:14011246-Alexandrium_andersonii.AAC.1